MFCISLWSFRRDIDNDELGIKDVPTEENMAYSCLPTSLISPDINSTMQILVKENLSYASYSVGQTVSEGPARNNEYETVDATPYKQ